MKSSSSGTDGDDAHIAALRARIRARPPAFRWASEEARIARDVPAALTARAQPAAAGGSSSSHNGGSGGSGSGDNVSSPVLGWGDLVARGRAVAASLPRGSPAEKLLASALAEGNTTPPLPDRGACGSSSSSTPLLASLQQQQQQQQQQPRARPPWNGNCAFSSSCQRAAAARVSTWAREAECSGDFGAAAGATGGGVGNNGSSSGANSRATMPHPRPWPFVAASKPSDAWTGRQRRPLGPSSSSSGSGISGSGSILAAARGAPAEASASAAVARRLASSYGLRAFKLFAKERGLREPSSLQRLPTQTEEELKLAERRERAAEAAAEVAAAAAAAEAPAAAPSTIMEAAPRRHATPSGLPHPPQPPLSPRQRPATTVPRLNLSALVSAAASTERGGHDNSSGSSGSSGSVPLDVNSRATLAALLTGRIGRGGGLCGAGSDAHAINSGSGRCRSSSPSSLRFETSRQQQQQQHSCRRQPRPDPPSRMPMDAASLQAAMRALDPASPPAHQHQQQELLRLVAALSPTSPAPAPAECGPRGPCSSSSRSRRVAGMVDGVDAYLVSYRLTPRKALSARV